MIRTIVFNDDIWPGPEAEQAWGFVLPNEELVRKYMKDLEDAEDDDLWI